MRPFYFLFILLSSLLLLAPPAGGSPPKRPWRGFSGPAYLPPPRHHRPRQAVLDSIARAAANRRRTFPQMK